GKVDERKKAGDPAKGTTCFAGKGACLRSGKIVCSNKNWVCNARAASTSNRYERSCSSRPNGNVGADDDCDGYIDDLCVKTISGTLARSGSSDGSSTNLGQHNRPTGITWGAMGNTEYLFVADPGNRIIRRLTLMGQGQHVRRRERIVGQTGNDGGKNNRGQDGQGRNIHLLYPGALTADYDSTAKTSKYLYFSDLQAFTIRRVDLTAKQNNNNTWNVVTLAGAHKSKGNANGSGTSARFGEVFGLALSEDNKTLYITDASYHNVRFMNLSGTGLPSVQILAGSINGQSGGNDGNGTSARFERPMGSAFYKDSSGRKYLYVLEGLKGEKSSNQRKRRSRIRRIDLNPGKSNRVETWVTSDVFHTQCMSTRNVKKKDNDDLRDMKHSAMGLALRHGRLYASAHGGHRYCVFSLTRKNVYFSLEGAGVADQEGKLDFTTTDSRDPRANPVLDTVWGITLRRTGTGAQVIYFTEFDNHTVRVHPQPYLP
ncbi:MAG: hypothetical protein AAGJ35_08010, partial [Myxococcota bacterium]